MGILHHGTATVHTVVDLLLVVLVIFLDILAVVLLDVDDGSVLEGELHILEGYPGEDVGICKLADKPFLHRNILLGAAPS